MTIEPTASTVIGGVTATTVVIAFDFYNI